MVHSLSDPCRVVLLFDCNTRAIFLGQTINVSADFNNNAFNSTQKRLMWFGWAEHMCSGHGNNTQQWWVMTGMLNMDYLICSFSYSSTSSYNYNYLVTKLIRYMCTHCHCLLDLQFSNRSNTTRQQQHYGSLVTVMRINDEGYKALKLSFGTMFEKTI